MQELTLTPFSEEENNSEYQLNTFYERGKDFTILKNLNDNRVRSGTSYKFGVVDDNGNFYWFFNGKAVVKGRVKAQQTFNHLQVYCSTRKIGTPFAYKKN